MKNIIKLKAEKGKAYININTLRFCTCTLFINADSEKNWVQINESEVDKFIAEQKAQIQSQATSNETPEVKTE